MGRISGTDAISSGFRLIGREPLAFLAWTVTYLVVCVLPQYGFMAVILPEWQRMAGEVATMGSGPGAAMPAHAFEAQARMMQLQPLLLLSSLVGHTLVTAAVYRAILFPEDRRFLYLRLGARELWLGLTMLVLFVLIAILTFGLLLLVGVIGGIIGFASHAPDGLALMAPLAVCLVVGTVCWVWLRFSLATPMSFAAPGFRLYESWGPTRGHAGKMFLIVLAFFVMIVVTELVIMAGVMGAIGGFAGLAVIGDWFQHPGHLSLATLAPWMAGAGLASGLFTTAFMTVIGAAWAEIYREIGAEADPA